VREVMKADFATIPEYADMKAVRDALISAEGAKIFVIGDDHAVLGSLTLPDLPDQAVGGSTGDPLTAGRIARPNPPLLQGSDDIGDALHLMNETGENHIGVIDNF
jgi:CIC family chloride channel protein